MQGALAHWICRDGITQTQKLSAKALPRLHVPALVSHCTATYCETLVWGALCKHLANLSHPPWRIGALACKLTWTVQNLLV